MSDILKPTFESATPEQTPASAETLPVAETANSASDAAAAAASAAYSGDAGNSPHERPRARATSHRNADASTSGERGLAERLLALLALFALPPAALDRPHLNRAGDGETVLSIQGRIFWRVWTSLGATALPPWEAILFAKIDTTASNWPRKNI